MENGIPELGAVRRQFVCFTGVDGTGKSTQALRLVEILKSRGIRADYVYLRTPHFFSKPLMGLCRVLGVNEYVKTDDGSMVRGFHHFHRSRILSWAVPWLQALDMHFFTWKDVSIPRMLGKTVVCDRYVVDTLVDIIVETRRLDLAETRVGRFFMRAHPEDVRMFVLQGDEAAIRSRKSDLQYDRWFDEKNGVFSGLMGTLSRYEPVVIDTTQQGVDEVFEQVVTHLSEKEGAEPRYWLKALRYLVAQGMLYTGNTERGYRLAALLLLTCAFALPLGIALPPAAGLAIALAFPLAHLANFLLNGSFWALVICDLKLARPRGKKALYEYLMKLRGRARKCDAIQAYCAYGSIARKGLHDASDLDMVLIRKPGLRNAAAALKFVAKERLIALKEKIPLELWLGDSPAYLSRFRPDEVAVVIRDTDETLGGHFHATQSIEESVQSNGDGDLFEVEEIAEERLP